MLLIKPINQDKPISNLTALTIAIRIDEYDDDLEVLFDKEGDYLLSIQDKDGDEEVEISARDFPSFVQTFLMHYNRYSTLSQTPYVTEIDVPLPNNRKVCRMRMEEEYCIFVSPQYIGRGREYEVKVCFQNMNTILEKINALI